MAFDPNDFSIQYLDDASKESRKCSTKQTICSEVTFSDSLDIQAVNICMAESCNLGCKYCFFNEGTYNSSAKKLMTFEVLINIYDKLLPHSSSGIRSFGFYGGEPLLAFDVIEKFTEYVVQSSKTKPAFGIITNGTLINQKMIDFFHKHKFYITISLDGFKKYNDEMRIAFDGSSVYDKVVQNVSMIDNRKFRLCAEATISPNYLIDYRQNDIDAFMSHFFDLGFDNIIPLVADIKGVYTDELYEKIELFYKDLVDYSFSCLLDDSNFTKPPVFIVKTISSIAKKKYVGYSPYFESMILVNQLLIVSCLLPFKLGDGYFAFSEVIGDHNLRKTAINFLIKKSNHMSQKKRIKVISCIIISDIYFIIAIYFSATSIWKTYVNGDRLLEKLLILFAGITVVLFLYRAIRRLLDLRNMKPLKKEEGCRNMNTSIQIGKLTKIYPSGEFPVFALKEIDLEIHSGSFIVVLGHSGSGKTTLFNILAGIDLPTEGSVYVNGVDITKFKDKKRTLYRREQVGIIFQYYNLLSDLTAYENIKIGCDLSKDSLNIEDVAEKLKISNLLSRFPHQLSGGQQQRVAIARALVKNPEIILCDEPTSALDSATTADFLEVLKECNQAFRKTILLITHNTDISVVADRVVTLKDGRIMNIKDNH